MRALEPSVAVDASVRAGRQPPRRHPRVGLGARTWQRGPGVSASSGEPPAAAVSGGSGGQRL